MVSNRLKILAVCLLLGIVGCKQAASDSTAARPPLLPPAESQEVLRILSMTDELDKMVRTNTTGQAFVDLATQVEAEYRVCQAKLPEQNAAGEVFRQIITGYGVAKTLITGKVTNSPQNPVDVVAASYIRKTMLRRVLAGTATERDWQAFEAGTKTGN